MSLIKHRNAKYVSIWFITEKKLLKGFWHKGRKNVCKITMKNIKRVKSNFFVYKGS